MTGKWRKVRISDIAERVAMGPFGSSIKVETFVPDGVPIISGQHLNGFKVDDSAGYNFITLQHAERLKNANVQRGDIVLTHRGNIGQVSYIPDDSKYERYVISQSQFYMRCDRSKATPEFVVAYFKTAEGQHKLLANTSQVGVPSIAQPVTYLRTIEIPLPPLPEQRAIAHILGTLDDKIELNRRMSETLEQMARALFKAWFVDFEPVRAKMEGRWRRGESLPGLPAHLYDLFPDRLVDSELGEIPEGWGIGKLGTLSEKPQYGYTASAREEPVGPKFLRITDINKLAWIDWSTVPYCEIEQQDFEQYRLYPGDVLIARMADPGHGVVIEEQVEAVFASYLIRFRLKDQAYIRYIQYWLRSDGYWELVTSRHAGTTRASLNAQVLSSFQLIIPPKPIVSVFSEIADALRNKVVAATNESRTLAALRDTLLPKLISGVLRVTDAERFLEERGV